jgi:outer membrane protein assembly factor BamB
VAWVHRSRVERFLAPVESDYTPDWNLTPEYPRPEADLTPTWKVDLEPGYGGAAIEGEDVFVLDRKFGIADTLRVFDLLTGEEKWSFSYPAPGRLKCSGSRTTPVVVESLVYLCGPFGQVHCIDRRTRAPVWSLDLERDCGGRRPAFGWAASPLVLGTLVVLPALGPEIGLVAFDRFTGELVWRTAALGYSHSTPVVLELLGKSQVVFVSSPTQSFGSERPAPATISSFDPRTGAELWRTETPLTSVPIPPAVQVDDEHFFLTGGYSGGSVLMRIGQEEGEYSLEEVFRIEKGAQLHPPVVHEDHIYLLANENSNESRRRRKQGGLTCLTLAGEELWSTGDDPYLGRGHVMLLGDYLLVQDGQSGMLRLCLATPRGYTPLATANVFESEPKARRKMWAPMAHSGGTFIVRGQAELRCVHLGGR